MNAFEIHFDQGGNTVVGNYVFAEKIYAAKPDVFPFGKTITAETSQDARRLVEHVSLWHNCLKTVKSWEKVCELAGCSIRDAKDSQQPACGLCGGSGEQTLYDEKWPCPACNGQG